jgi:hypothetical protein
MLFSGSSLAQKSISDLAAAHSNALQSYLAENPELKFLSEESCDREYLEMMRGDFGARFTPFYQQGDFNRDGKRDFAVVLLKNVPPQRNPDLAESHQLEYQLVIVIFNGASNRSFKAVFSESVTAPLVCFINITRDKKKQLYFAVSETDFIFTMIPKEGGYRIIE